MSLPYGIVIGRIYQSGFTPERRMVTRIQRVLGKGTRIHWTVIGRSPPQHGESSEKEFLAWALQDVTPEAMGDD